VFNPLKHNDPYSGRATPLTSKRCILYIYSTNTGIEYFKHGIYSPFFPLKNAVCFIILTYLVPLLFTFYIQSVLKLKKKKSGAKRLILRCRENQDTHIAFNNFILSQNRAVNEIMWGSVVGLDRPQMTIWRMLDP